VVQKTFELVKFANVYAISKLVEKFDKRSELLDSGLNFELKDLYIIFALNLCEVDKDWL
jgi:hypothetical protein